MIRHTRTYETVFCVILLSISADAQTASVPAPRKNQKVSTANSEAFERGKSNPSAQPRQAAVSPPSPADEKVVAVVNGRKITQSEVDASVTSQLFPLQQQIHALRKAALDNIVLRTILEDEAKKKGVSVEELRRQLTVGKVEILPSQVEQVYLENASAFAAMSPDEAKERLRLDLESQARMRIYREALAKLKGSSVIDLRLEEPALPTLNTGGSTPSIGAKEAAVTITEFSDFQCPYCKESQSAIKQVLERYSNNVRLIFRHLPLDIHPHAFSSAQAAFCAGEQGLFWQYHDALFASPSLAPEALDKLASELRLDIPKFKSCFNSEASRVAVLRDVQEAKRLGISGAPTFIINGKLLRGAPSFEALKTIVERELKSTQSSSRQE